MNRFVRIIVALVALAAFGLVRLPIEQAMTVDMREQGIQPAPLDATTTERLGQTGAIVALGGLRSFAASLFAFSAWSEFERSNWRGLEDDFVVITTLQPHSRYYWNSGSWHLAYNASAFYKNDEDLRPARREIMERRYIEKGRNMLERGLRLNPDNRGLKLDMIRLLTDPYKPQDFPEAARLIDEVIAMGDATPLVERRRVYILVRMPETYQRAYDLARELFQKDVDNHVPSLLCIIIALQHALDVPDDDRLTIEQVFGSAERAYRNLVTYRQNASSSGYPQHGIVGEIRKLETQLNVPEDRRMPSAGSAVR